MEPTPEARAEAKQTPGGWVYAIDGHYDRNGRVPPHAIEGAWKVNDDGEITGEFIPNPNYDRFVAKPENGEPTAPAGSALPWASPVEYAAGVAPADVGRRRLGEHPASEGRAA